MRLYIVILLLFIDFTCSDYSLQSLHILFRHGERSPTKTYTNDPYINYPWPGGFDQLNNRGKRELYELGKQIRNEYNFFISDYFASNDMYIMSSYADRCIMSAQLLLAGLYPPVGEQIWSNDLLWQPIPVRFIERSLDNKIAIKKRCPKYDEVLKGVRANDLKDIDNNNTKLYDYLSNHTGDEIRNILAIELLYNTLEIQYLNNLTLPEWTDDVFPQKMKDLAALSLAIFTKTDFMKRMHGGALLKEILDNIKNKISGNLKPKGRKIFLYSGHDLTVVSLLRILGFEELLKPEFGASIFIEHHKINETDIIKILYKANQYEQSILKKLNNCDESCDFKDFLKNMEKYLPDDWDKECEL